MIVLDTKVVSELMRASPEPRVLDWLDRQDIRRLFVTVVTESEIRTGIASLLTGRLRDGLAQAAAFIAAWGVRVQAVMTDGAWGYTRVAAFRTVLAQFGGRHLVTRPNRPQTNGKA